MSAPRLERPIIVLGCNRSGTTLLFNNLSAHPDTWSLYIESQDIFYRHHSIHPELGDRLTEPPTETEREDIERYFYRTAHNKEFFKDTPGLRRVPRKLLQRPLNPLYKGGPLRLVEKTPSNSLRVPYLAKLFPDAKWLFLVRRGEDVVSSLMEGWKNWSRSGDHWHYTRWHYLVPPGWRDYTTRNLQEICAFQWVESNRMTWEDLNTHLPGRFLMLRHEDLMADPNAAYRRIREYCGLRPSGWFDRVIANIRGRVYTTGGSAPRREKWRDMHEREIMSVQTMLDPVNALFYPPRGDGVSEALEWSGGE